MIGTRDDVYRDHPSTAPTRYETLSGAQTMAALERALHILLTPLEYPDAGAWLDAACAAFEQATGAEVPVPTAASEDTVWDAIERTLHDHTAAGRGEIAAGRGEHSVSAAAVERAALVRVLVPPFKAGIAEWRRQATRRAELAALLDVIPEPVLMYDHSGSLVHENPRAMEMFGMSGTDGLGSHVRTEAQRMAWSLAASARRSSAPPSNGAGAQRSGDSASSTPSAVREVRAAGRVYRLRGTLAAGWNAGGRVGVLVTAASELVNPLTDAELRDRFGLSSREVEVARLVASGLSNQEVAERLGVSYFTARNHVERLLSKLGVRNRSRVGAVLRNEAA